MKLLAIETSCDETAAAVVQDGREVLSSLVRSQIDLHRLYNGVVPEVASRAHAECISQLTREALQQADTTLAQLSGIAVTAWPGLIGALLVGVNFAKSLACATGLPLVPVHHLRGHVAACYLAHPQLAPPFVALVVSGGHTSLVFVKTPVDYRTLGRTRDDAAGECFDKVARLLGLPYPGGVALDALSQGGDPTRYRFPAAEVAASPLDFSFSGLKTAAATMLRQQQPEPSDFAASLMQAVAQALCTRLRAAARETEAPALVVAGGVAANSWLRAGAAQTAQELGVPLFLPPAALCGDNAAMIGAQGCFELRAGHTAGFDLNAQATREISQG